MNHPLWASFAEYADDNGIDLEFEDDWRAWWECYLAGSIAGVKAVVQSQLGPIAHELDHLKKEAETATAEVQERT